MILRHSQVEEVEVSRDIRIGLVPVVAGKQPNPGGLEGWREGVGADHLRDFSGMAGIKFLLIDENTNVNEFRDRLRWNDLYYQLNKVL